jgi:uncharacterized Zn-finger protein
VHRSCPPAGERPYRCTVGTCTKAYSSESKLRAHVRAHDKPFVCPVEGCRRPFGYSVDLKRHLEKKHGTKPQATSLPTSPVRKGDKSGSSREQS